MAAPSLDAAPSAWADTAGSALAVHVRLALDTCHFRQQAGDRKYGCGFRNTQQLLYSVAAHAANCPPHLRARRQRTKNDDTATCLYAMPKIIDLELCLEKAWREG